MSAIYPVIDTHTHFDAPVFDMDRPPQAQQAYGVGVHHLVLVGYLYRYFARLYDTQQSLLLPAPTPNPQAHIALGLHPFYIEQHTEAHLEKMAQMLMDQRPLAIGEIGLDTFTNTMKQPDIFAKQQRFFLAQLDMAVTHQLPVMLHIRKAHAEALTLLKTHAYSAHQLGGIVHSFSGGEQEAKAFVKLGFKLGVTGQISNPNAKKLRRAIMAVVDSYGIECLVIETDCPDMMPIMCQTSSHQTHLPNAVPLAQKSADDWQQSARNYRNIPANLPWVLVALSDLLHVTPADLAPQLWQNSTDALQCNWVYPTHNLP